MTPSPTFTADTIAFLTDLVSMAGVARSVMMRHGARRAIDVGQREPTLGETLVQDQQP
jgi:hypothetical protein